MEDEIKIWGNLKHDNVIKSFIWMEDFSPKNPHDSMYLMMQFADMGEIASWKEAEHRYQVNEALMQYLENKLTEEEEFKQFGVPFCASMRERIAMFIF
jgi:hypothetical protein